MKQRTERSPALSTVMPFSTARLVDWDAGPRARLPKVTSKSTSVRLPNASRGRRSPKAQSAAKKVDGAARSTLTSKGQRTRQSLVDAARLIFEREGFLHARISDICAAAKTSHGSFYTYFKSKEEIFKEVTDSVELALLTVDASAHEVDEIARIREANRRYLARFKENAKILAVIQQVSTFDPDVRRTRIHRQDAFAALIERRIHKLQDEGRADASIDARFAANALGGMVAFMAEQSFIHKRFKDENTAVEQLTQLWANAIGLTP
jgi:AcrR family transcriptional regulator